MSRHQALSIDRNELSALRGTYRLLARLWLRELDAPLLQQLRSPPLCDDFVQAGGVLPAEHDDKTIEELAVDYCQLFVGPMGHLPPYQSVWQNGQFQSRTTTAMSEFIDVVGYEFDTLTRPTMLDHLGVQLDVMASILDHCSTSDRTSGGFDSLVKLAHTFYVRHLTWPSTLLESAAGRARSDFYRSTILLTGDFLHAEQRFWLGSHATSAMSCPNG